MKRTRRGSFRSFKVRPVNKKIINVLQNPTTTQVLTTISGPANDAAGYTFKLNKMSLSAIGEATQSTLVRWAIIVVREGYEANTLGATDGTSLYNPEQNVLAFGTLALSDSDSGTGSTTVSQNFRLKASRKLQEGDRIRFVSDTNNATAVQILAVIQWVQLY